MPRLSFAPLLAAAVLGLPAAATAGIVFDTPADTVVVTFDAGSPGVNGGGPYLGNGFDVPGGTAGTLDSDAFALAGMSDGNLNFGGTALGGDFGRGVDADGGVVSGGAYAFQNGANTFLGFQPTGADFTPGSLFLRVQNLSGGVIDEVAVDYDLLVNNDQARANSFNFGFATGAGVADPTALSFTGVPGLDYTSPEAADALGFRTIARSTTLSALGLANGDFLYLQFFSDDVSGGGSRDEFGLDNIRLAAAAIPEPTTWALMALAGLGTLVRRRFA